MFRVTLWLWHYEIVMASLSAKLRTGLSKLNRKYHFPLHDKSISLRGNNNSPRSPDG
jgi:hypothetical protein